MLKNILLRCLLLGGLFPQLVLSKPVTLIDSFGEKTIFEVGSTDSFLDVLEDIQFYFQEKDPLACEASTYEKAIQGKTPLNFVMSHAGITIRSAKKYTRDYETSVAKQEKKEIAYIVKTLAYDSLISIGTSRSSLKKAGERIDHLHPFRFLMTIFSDEELKAGAHAIRDRGGLTWNGFIDGITGSLKEESSKQNLLQFTADFSKKVKIDPDLIISSLQQGKWKEFVTILIDKIPREIDPNRYDM